MPGVIIAIIIGVIIGIIDWKTSQGQYGRKKSKGGWFFTLVTLPICLLDDLVKWARKK